MPTIGIVSVCDATLNTFVIAETAKYQQLREDRTNLFTMSILFSDLIFGITCMPISAILCWSVTKHIWSLSTSSMANLLNIIQFTIVP